MNNVAGIDVSKGKSMVSVLRPFGEVVAKPFAVGHTGSELKELANYLKSLDGETRVVMEHTGRYYEPVARFLHEEGIFVSAVNPKLIKDYVPRFGLQCPEAPGQAGVRPVPPFFHGEVL